MTSAPPPRSALPGITAAQEAYVASQLGTVELLADMSWGDIDSTVLHARVSQAAPDRTLVMPQEVVIKACGTGPGRHHFTRELDAYRAGAVAPLIRAGRGAACLGSDEGLGVLLLAYQPGALVAGGAFQLDASVHREAGRLLRLIHADPTPDAGWDARATARALRWLGQPHRLPPADAAAARRLLEARTARPRPAVLVHTHGDYHPRNWLRGPDGFCVIDWGRYERRPAYTDWVRCAGQEWREKPELAAAFAEGYGQDLRDSDDWKMEYLRQGVGTACWAPTIGDEAFERQGWRMVREALEMLEPLAKRLDEEEAER